MSERAPAKRDRFDMRVALSPEEIWERLLANPRVRHANDPAPDPAPPDGSILLVARASPTEIRLRHWAGPADASSPVVVLQMREQDGVTTVHGHFHARRRQGPLVETRVAKPSRLRARATIAAVVLTVAIAAPLLLGVAPVHLLAVFVLLLFLLLCFSVPTALVFVPAVMIWNREVRKGFVGPMWELLGETFTPIALPSADGRQAPFRHSIRGER